MQDNEPKDSPDTEDSARESAPTRLAVYQRIIAMWVKAAAMDNEEDRRAFSNYLVKNPMVRRPGMVASDTGNR